MERRWLGVAVMVLVLVNLGVLYALLNHRHDTPSGPSGVAAGGSAAGRGSSPGASASGPSPSPSGGGTKHAGPSPSPLPGLRHSSGAPSASAGGRLVLDEVPLFAAPFHPVAIRGTWKSPPATTPASVRVEVRRGGHWSAFPLPAFVTSSGRFTAYASLGPQGSYEVRVVGDGGGPASMPVVVTVG